MNRFWTPEKEAYLRAHYPNSAPELLAAHLGCTYTAMRSRAKLLKVQRAGRQLWSAEEEAYLRAHYETTLTKSIADHLGRTIFKVYAKAKKLGLSKPEEFFKDPANRCRLQKGSDIGKAFRFKKGDVPANKGLKMPGWAPGRMKETQFKKGVLNGTAKQLHRPIGTILADPEGYLRIKVREHDENTRGWHKDVWPLLHHKIWIEHKGPIPPGHVVIFIDKDRNNCAIENLDLISTADNMRRNSMWATMPRELAEVIQLTGVLKRQIRNKEQHATE